MKSDYEQIVELMAVYGRMCDARQYELLDACFVPDGVIRYMGFGEPLVGTDAIREFLERALTPLDATQHLFGNFTVDIEGESGSFRCLVQAQHARGGVDGGHLYTIGGHYENQLVRTQDGWRMTELVFWVTWKAGNPTILAHVETPERSAA